MTHTDLTKLLSGYPIPFGNETEMQTAIARILEEHGITYEREYAMSKRDRIDFVVGDGIGVECKVDGGPSEVLEQCIRYAQHPEIEALILVTRRSRQVFAVPTLNDKPFSVVWVARHL